MGVDVIVVNMIGIHFESHDGGEEFIRTHFENVPEEIDSDDYEDITGGLTWQMISAYDDYSGVIGIEIGASDLDAQGIGVQEAWKKAFALFPKEVHNKIKPHSWAMLC